VPFIGTRGRLHESSIGSTLTRIMRLYHQPRSRSLRVLWALAEADADYDLQLLAREQKSEGWYRALHPLGRAPVAELAEGPLFESAALVWYVCDLHPAAGLAAPVGSYERGLQYQWSFFASSELEPPLNEIARQLWGGGEPDEALIAAARERFGRAAQVIGDALGEHEFMVGDRFSVADLGVGAVTGFARFAELAELPPVVDAYVQRMEARPALMAARARQA
jgi:glutathione S-transferase